MTKNINFEDTVIIRSTNMSNRIITGLFYDTAKNLVICTKSNAISLQINSCNTISCSENWRDNQFKLYNGQCHYSCDETNNKYHYLSKCVNTCPQSTYTIEYLLKCVDICPSSTYAFDNKCEKCHPDCKTCNGPFNNIDSNCIMHILR